NPNAGIRRTGLVRIAVLSSGLPRPSGAANFGSVSVTRTSSPRSVANTDQVLVQRMARGDERALGELYDRHAAVLYGLAYTIVGERADAEEVVADSFGQAWRGAVQFDPGRGSVSAWLVTIGRTRALDLVRARGRRSRALERAASFVDDTGPEATDRPAERAEARGVVTRALASLPEAQRRAIELAYFGGLSQSEIAAQLGEPLGTIKTRIRDGMAKLREMLTKEGVR
ncbi:MAG TPA: sigma-70 family RNA polymerase sigma factor, partial [Gemmatimonadales bacterium]|nr:sigma-70 family RNA polymerase sigma factor [Gemmatimonadales bacterium]